MAASTELDLAETVRLIQRLSLLVDFAWQEAGRTGAPGALVLALDEASLGLHRARVALNDSVFGATVPSDVERDPAARHTGTGHGQLADVTTGTRTLAFGGCERSTDG
jgi:hypothetical protein